LLLLFLVFSCISYLTLLFALLDTVIEVSQVTRQDNLSSFRYAYQLLETINLSLFAFNFGIFVISALGNQFATTGGQLNNWTVEQVGRWAVWEQVADFINSSKILLNLRLSCS